MTPDIPITIRKEGYFQKWKSAIQYHKLKVEIEKRETEVSEQPEASESESLQAETFDWRRDNEKWIDKMSRRKRPDLNWMV